MPPRRKTAEPDTAVAYVRVSTDEQAESGLGLDAQRSKITAECERRDWRIVDWFDDPGVSGGLRVEERPKLVAALDRIESGGAAALIVAKLDRLSRSASDAAGLLERSQRNGWALVACDLGVDTSTPAGEMMANVMGTFARFEKRLIGQRTSEALQAKKRQGIQLGTPRRTSDDLVRRIVAMRQDGASLAAIAAQLNTECVPTVQGGARWWPSTIAAVLGRSISANDEEQE
jgi:DNA invertase Pin-like site-specific DNA recombinase